MNTTQKTSRAIKGRLSQVLAGLASIVLAGAAFAAAPAAATADQFTDGGGSTASAPAPSNTALDIDDIVTLRKTAMAQDRIDRAWLYR